MGKKTLVTVGWGPRPGAVIYEGEVEDITAKVPALPKVPIRVELPGGRVVEVIPEKVYRFRGRVTLMPDVYTAAYEPAPGEEELVLVVGRDVTPGAGQAPQWDIILRHVVPKGALPRGFNVVPLDYALAQARAEGRKPAWYSVAEQLVKAAGEAVA